MRADIRSIELGGATNLAVLAPVKTGLAQGFEPISYLERLRRLLEALQASRQNVRESELQPSVFPDTLGRFGIISNFRYVLVPPERVASERWHLSLNITFDGGWEPYMRVIHRDIGPLLDALFCHCDGYPDSRSASYDDYCRWVRSNEVGGGIFFTDSAVTVGDQRYLAAVEKLQRENADPRTAERLIARHAQPSDVELRERALAAVRADPRVALALPVRTLKGMYKLSNHYSGVEGDVLLRFAQLTLAGFKGVIETAAFQALPIWQAFAQTIADELAWFQRSLPRAALVTRNDFAPEKLQAPLREDKSGTTHGCVVMLEVKHADQALIFLQGLRPRCAAPPDATTAGVHVALTHAGLQALGMHATRLDRLPPEFAEGMEARCGLLGDVRGNHPDRWLRPLRHGGTSGERIDLGSVHVVVVLRFVDSTNPAHTLHPKLAPEVTALHTSANTGLAVLAVQPTRSNRIDAERVREHFGFADGFSQPKAISSCDPAQRKGDEVCPGELVLGQANQRGDDAWPAGDDPLLEHGSFLVVRKLRQRLDHLEAALGAAPVRDAVMAKMVGRRQDGTPLVPTGPGGANDFNYDADREGRACPFQSHVRRANPRDGRAYTPRILRRGMSYGPSAMAAGPQAERGLVFMAYCASIAEQFEVIQRWIAGGNSSGVSSAQADPLLAVPQAHERRTFRYIDDAGEVTRVDLGSRPFVELEWGLYLFVPSLEALGRLAEFRTPRVTADAAQGELPQADDLEVWRAKLEDKQTARQTWSEVRGAGGESDAPPYGHLIGSADKVLAVLKDDGTKYSVHGFGKRMRATVGLNYLGMDPATGHDQQAPGPNGIVFGVDEPTAFAAALPVVKAALERFKTQPLPDPSGPLRCPVDLMKLAEAVVAALSRQWFGLPDGDLIHGDLMITGGRMPHPASGKPRCPGHLIGPSRTIFTPHPRAEIIEEGEGNGPLVLDAVRKMLASGQPVGELTEKIKATLQHIPANERDEVLACTVSGTLLGFPPTVYGNFLSVLANWIESKDLWTLQNGLAGTPGTTEDYPRAESALRGALLAAMRREPVPSMLWRNPVEDGKVIDAPERQVILGNASAIVESEVAQGNALLFGGDYDPKSPYKTTHACPGAKMGIGVLLAMIAGLLDAGTLRPTGSPVLVILTPKPAA